MAKGTLKRIASVKQIAELFEVTPRWISRLAKEKDFPKIARGKYDLKACVQWYVRYLRKQLDEATRDPEGLQKSEERKSKYQADMLELKLKMMQGELVSIDAMLSLIEPVLAAMKGILISVPKKISQELGNKDAEPVVESFIHRALDELTTIPEKLLSGKESPGQADSEIQDLPTAAKAPRKRVGRHEPVAQL